jgi:hypothetical protein
LWIVVGKSAADLRKLLKKLAGTTRLELATSAVTGQRSNQLNYVPSLFSWVCGKPLIFLSFLTVDTVACVNQFHPDFQGFIDRKP